MNLWFWISFSVAIATTLCFAGTLQFYFGRSPRVTPAKHFMVVSIWLGTAIQLGVLIQSREVHWGYRLAGLICFLLAHWVFWTAIRAHGNSPPQVAFSDITPGQLVTSGPYGYIRHPFYTAYTLAWVGGGLLCGNCWLFLIAIWMFRIYYIAAKQEEAALQSKFLDRYSRYRKKTGMFLP